MLRDANFARHRVIRRIPYSLFGFLPHTVSTAVDGALGMDTGTPQIQEFSTAGFGGVSIAATTDQLGVLDLNYIAELDYTQTVGVRVVWTDDVATPAAGDAVGWVVKYLIANPGNAGTALAVGSTALNTVVASQTPATTVGRKLRRTARGVVNADTFDATDATGGIVWTVKCSTITSYSANEIKFLALELDFFPKYFRFANQAETYLTSAGAQ